MRKVLSFFVLLCLLAGFGCAFADEIPEVGLEAALEQAGATAAGTGAAVIVGSAFTWLVWGM